MLLCTFFCLRNMKGHNSRIELSPRAFSQISEVSRDHVTSFLSSFFFCTYSESPLKTKELSSLWKLSRFKNYTLCRRCFPSCRTEITDKRLSKTRAMDYLPTSILEIFCFKKWRKKSIELIIDRSEQRLFFHIGRPVQSCCQVQCEEVLETRLRND